MSNIRWIVKLADDERAQLDELVAGGTLGARKMKRALTLQLADQGWLDADIAEAVRSGTSTVYRTRRRFVEDGLGAALSEAPRPGGLRKLTAADEATLVAQACSKPPEGRAKWTMQLLADRLVVLTDQESVSAETVRRRLKEKKIKPWQQKMWCIGEITPGYVARMEAVLDLYQEPHDPRRPLICFDEAPTQMVSETRAPIPASPGQPIRIDYEYRRNGTTNIFMMVDPHRGWRNVDVTKRRTNVDFAHQMRRLVDEHYPDADVVRVVLDNLSTHTEASLYGTFEPAEARRILRRLEFHFTPKHGSWLNMAEIEIGVMKGQCLARRIGDLQTLVTELQTWQRQRNLAGTKINWLFDVAAARTKLKRHYPVPATSREKLHDAA